MATQEEVQRRLREREEAERKNPLLRMGLGDLIREAQRTILENPNRITGYSYYDNIIKEINRRENEYYRRSEINRDLIGKSLRAEGYEKI